MCKNALGKLESEGLDLGGVVVKRAQWEALAVSLCPDGEHVNVKNESYGDEIGHTHTVTVDDGVPVTCTCKADEYGETPCKHRAYVALNDVVLAAVRGDLLADGGQKVAERDEDGVMCVKGTDWCPGPDADTLPCFACYCCQTKA